MSTVKTGALAAAAALLALSAATLPGTSVAKDADVHCYGVNSCKGQSDCKSAHNDCKGMNSCKGQGFKAVASAKACTKQGGSLTEPK